MPQHPWMERRLTSRLNQQRCHSRCSLCAAQKGAPLSPSQRKVARRWQPFSISRDAASSRVPARGVFVGVVDCSASLKLNQQRCHISPPPSSPAAGGIVSPRGRRWPALRPGARPSPQGLLVELEQRQLHVRFRLVGHDGGALLNQQRCTSARPRPATPGAACHRLRRRGRRRRPSQSAAITSPLLVAFCSWPEGARVAVLLAWSTAAPSTQSAAMPHPQDLSAAQKLRGVAVVCRRGRWRRSRR